MGWDRCQKPWKYEKMAAKLKTKYRILKIFFKYYGKEMACQDAAK